MGICREPVCEAGEKRCEGDTLHVCDAAGLRDTEIRCASAAVCDALRETGTCDVAESTCGEDGGDCSSLRDACTEDPECTLCAFAGSSEGCTDNAAFVAMAECICAQWGGGEDRPLDCCVDLCVPLGSPCSLGGSPCCDTEEGAYCQVPEGSTDGVCDV
jgi:hypothetical protein